MVSQFFPGVVFGLYWRRVTAMGIAAGLVAGVGTAAFLILTKRDPFFGCNAGFVALMANFAVAVIASLATRPRKGEWDLELADPTK